MEYLINVAITFTPYFAVVSVLLVFMYAIQKMVEVYLFAQSVKIKDDQHLDSFRMYNKSLWDIALKKIVPAILLFGLVFSLVSPSNTYKHGSGHDRHQRDAQIQQFNRTTTAAPIQDISRQPAMNAEERKEYTRSLSDYNNRANTD
jgi:hypothetical protein